MHGGGKLTFADGSIYSGFYVKDKKHGKGIFTHADGKLDEGEWVDDSYKKDGCSVF